MERTCFYVTTRAHEAFLHWGEEQKLVAELPDGTSFLGGQEINVTREGERTWINQVGGRMFTSDPGRCADGFQVGLRRYRRVATCVVAGQSEVSDVRLEHVECPRYCYISGSSSRNSPGFHVSGVKFWVDLGKDYGGKEPGHYAVPLPSSNRHSINVRPRCDNARWVLDISPNGPVLITNGPLISPEMKIFHDITVPCEGFNGLDNSEGSSLFDCRLLFKVPKIVLQQSLILDS